MHMLTYRDPLAQDENLAHFTDRRSELERFEALITETSNLSPPILVLHGAAGEGKSWLLTRCRSLAEHYGIPTARVTFDQAYDCSGFRRDFGRVLHVIRAQLGVDCPKFELAYAMYRYKAEGCLRPEFQGEGWLASGFVLVSKLAGCGLAALSHGLIAGGAEVESWLLERLGANVGPRLRDCATGQWLLQRAGLRDYIHLLTSEAQTILRELPHRLANDLEHNLPIQGGQQSALSSLGQWMTCRAVIFLDACEWLDDDAWLRSFCSQSMPVQFVFAGQKPLGWDEPYWLQPGKMELHYLGGLPELNAREYLTIRGINEQCLQDDVLEASREPERGTFHSLTLGWCADILLIEKERANPQGKLHIPAGDLYALAERFLRAMPEAQRRWIEALALTPVFDEDAGRYQYSETTSRMQDIAWEKLLSFSVVAPIKRGWYSLRPLARKAIVNRIEHLGNVTEERLRWQMYWSERSREETDELARLAWYQQWFLDPASALSYWIGLARNTMSKPAIADHASLLNWWDGTGIESGGPADRTHACALYALANEGCESTRIYLGGSQRREVNYYLSALRILKEEGTPEDRAKLENNLGNAYADLLEGDKQENLELARTHFESALETFTETTYPVQWAAIQKNLGTVFSEITQGRTRDNLRQAISFYRRALRVFKENTYPEEWAATQTNIGNVYFTMAPLNDATTLRKAIHCHESALRVYTEKSYPADWALVQQNLGGAYLRLADVASVANLEKAITSYENALRIYTKVTFPYRWATGQRNLGIALCQPGQSQKLERAIACFDLALSIFTEATLPLDWAATQLELAMLHSVLKVGDEQRNLRRAIECYENALRVYTRTNAPREWARAQNGLGVIYPRLQGDRKKNLRRALKCFRLTLPVWMPNEHNLAMAYCNLGTTLSDLGDDRHANRFRHAINCFKSALTIFKHSEYPADWARTKHNMGVAYLGLRGLSLEGDLRSAISCFQSALRVYTRTTYPTNWALTLRALSGAYAYLGDENSREYVDRAINCLELSLRVFTREKFPRDWAITQYNLGAIYAESPIGNQIENLNRSLRFLRCALPIYEKECMPPADIEVLRQLKVTVERRLADLAPS
jgi:tetratricopeptide (TPR) repeat protein